MSRVCTVRAGKRSGFHRRIDDKPASGLLSFFLGMCYICNFQSLSLSLFFSSPPNDDLPTLRPVAVTATHAEFDWNRRLFIVRTHDKNPWFQYYHPLWFPRSIFLLLSELCYYEYIFPLPDERIMEQFTNVYY